MHNNKNTTTKHRKKSTIKSLEPINTSAKRNTTKHRNTQQVTSGERKGAAGGIIGRLEDVEADMAMSFPVETLKQRVARVCFQFLQNLIKKMTTQSWHICSCRCSCFLLVVVVVTVIVIIIHRPCYDYGGLFRFVSGVDDVAVIGGVFLVLMFFLNWVFVPRGEWGTCKQVFAAFNCFLLQRYWLYLAPFNKREAKS